MREDCKQFESRSYPNGETVRKCNLDKAPEAPWRCPENCAAFEKRRVDVNWSYGSLITPETPEEPSSLGEDQSISALLNAAEDVINEEPVAVPDTSKVPDIVTALVLVRPTTVAVLAAVSACRR